jgi:hypothetical protein
VKEKAMKHYIFVGLAAVLIAAEPPSSPTAPGSAFNDPPTHIDD